MELCKKETKFSGIYHIFKKNFQLKKCKKFKQLYPQFDKINEKEIDKGMILQDFRNISDLIEYAKNMVIKRYVLIIVASKR